MYTSGSMPGGGWCSWCIGWWWLSGAPSATPGGIPAAPAGIAAANAGGRIAILANSRSGVHTGATEMARGADGGDANIATGVAGVPAGLANLASSKSAAAGREEPFGGARAADVGYCAPAVVAATAARFSAILDAFAFAVSTAVLAADLALRVDDSAPPPSAFLDGAALETRDATRDRPEEKSVSDAVL